MKLTIEIDDKRVQDLLCSALEGGSNYWYNIDNSDGSVTTSPEDVGVEYWHEVPFTEKGVIVFTANGDDENEEINGATSWKLDRAAIERGLTVFASLKEGEGGHHYGDFIKENDDAITGDVFLQCCLFGEIIYG